MRLEKDTQDGQGVGRAAKGDGSHDHQQASGGGHR